MLRPIALLALALLTAHPARAQEGDPAKRAALQQQYQANADRLAALYAANDLPPARPLIEDQARIMCALDGARALTCATGWHNVGALAIAEQRYDDAVGWFDRALAIERAHPDAQDNLIATLRSRAEALGMTGVYEPQATALKELIAAIEKRDGAPATVELWRTLASLQSQWLDRPATQQSLERALAIQIAAKGERDETAIEVMRGLTTMAFLRGDLDGARALAMKAATNAKALYGPLDYRTGSAVANWGNVERHRGAYDQATALLREAIAAFDADGVAFPGDRMLAMQGLAEMMEARERYAEAEPLRARIIEATDGDGNKGYAALYLAHNQLAQGKLEDARRLLSDTKVAVRSGKDPIPPLLIGLLDRDLARIALAQGQPAEANALLEEGLSITLGMLPKAYEATDLALWGAVKAALGDRDAATMWFRRAVEIVRENKLDGSDYGIEVKFRAGRFFVTDPATYAEGRTLVQQAYFGAELQRIDAPNDLFSQIGLARREDGRRQLFLTVADTTYRDMRTAPGKEGVEPNIGFGMLQRAMSNPATQAVALSAARSLAKTQGPAAGAQVAELQMLDTRIREDDLRLNARLADTSEAAIAERAAVTERLTADRARRAELAAGLDKSFPDYFGLVRPGAVPLETLQPLLAPDEVALLIVPGEDGTHIMAVTHDAVRWERSDWTATRVEAEVRRLLWFAGADVRPTNAEVADWQAEVPGIDAFDRKTAHRLYQTLIAPVAGLIAGKRHLFVAGAGPLAKLPFSILVSAPPTGADDDPEALRKTHWFADDVALIHLPSIQALVLLRQSQQRAAAPERFLGIGDPLLDGQPQIRERRGGGGVAPDMMLANLREPTVDLTALRRLARLPGTATELKALATATGENSKSLRLGADARESWVRAAPLDRYRILSFATHGIMAGEVGGAREAGLVLTPPKAAQADDDGYLATSDVAGLSLNADWVILSACNTASDDGSAGAAGLSGLTRAFFYAGARAVLASHWPVLDAVAPQLAVATVTAAPGSSRAEALQAAMRAVRNDATHDKDGSSNALPAAWAPFVIVGDWH